MTDRPAALVTGASRGVGFAIAKTLVKEGWDLTVCARKQDALYSAAEYLRESGTTVHAVLADLADSASAEKLAAAHESHFGRTDCLILNAGTGTVGEWRAVPAERLRRMLDVNVTAAYRLIQRLIPCLRQTAAARGPQGARVIAIASLAGVVAEPETAAYAASKAALISLCEALNTEESRNGICATAICPGFIDTDMTEWVRSRVPSEAMIPRSDIAQIVLALLQLSRQAVIPSVVVARPGGMLWRA